MRLMGKKIVESEEEVSVMFSDQGSVVTSDEQLAIHIMHRFNIDLDTMETMPAFEKHLKPMLFSAEKDE